MIEQAGNAIWSAAGAVGAALTALFGTIYVTRAKNRQDTPAVLLREYRELLAQLKDDLRDARAEVVSARAEVEELKGEVHRLRVELQSSQVALEAAQEAIGAAWGGTPKTVAPHW